jgi:hypothetical protein
MFFLTAFLVTPLALLGQEADPGYSGQPLDPSRPVVVRIAAPGAGDVLAENSCAVRLEAENYRLAPGGNRLLLFLDNRPPQLVDDLAAPIAFANLAEGGHTLRLLAVGPDGIARTNPEAFATARFFVHRRDFQNLVTLPCLTVGLPLNGLAVPDAEGKVWLDFKVSGGAVAPDGYKVRARLDRMEKTLSAEKPSAWTHLAPGRYHLTVDLLDASGQPVAGVFNQVDRTFDIGVPVKAIPLGRVARPPAAPGQTQD